VFEQELRYRDLLERLDVVVGVPAWAAATDIDPERQHREPELVVKRQVRVRGDLPGGVEGV